MPDRGRRRFGRLCGPAANMGPLVSAVTSPVEVVSAICRCRHQLRPLREAGALELAQQLLARYAGSDLVFCAVWSLLSILQLLLALKANHLDTQMSELE